MDQQINAYIESLVLGILNSPNFINLAEPQKSEIAEKLRGKFYDVILTTTIDNLTDEQVSQLQNIPADSPEMAQKIQEFSSTLPNLASEIEKALNAEYENLKQNPS